MLWSVIRLIFKTSSVTPDFFYVFNLILSFSTCSQSFKKSVRGNFWARTSLSPGQTIATCQRNISQHCWAQHVACVWPPCCDMLGVVGSNLTILKLKPTTPNMSQHIATWWPNARNMLRPTMLRYVALPCCDRLAGA